MADGQVPLARLIAVTEDICRALAAGQAEQLAPLLSTRQEILDEMRGSGFTPGNGDSPEIEALRESDARMHAMAAKMRTGLMEQMRASRDQKKAMNGYGTFLAR